MRKNLTLALFAASLFRLSADDSVARLGWMAGCWKGELGPVTVEEQWSTPAGGMMLGLSRTTKQGKVVFHEFMRIESAAGGVTYTPRIGTKAAPVEFRLKEQTASEVRFENPAHDFPQAIVYRRVKDGLHARIEGTQNGKRRAEDFPMVRVKCE